MFRTRLTLTLCTLLLPTMALAKGRIRGPSDITHPIYGFMAAAVLCAVAVRFYSAAGQSHTIGPVMRAVVRRASLAILAVGLLIGGGITTEVILEKQAANEEPLIKAGTVRNFVGSFAVAREDSTSRSASAGFESSNPDLESGARFMGAPR